MRTAHTLTGERHFETSLLLPDASLGQCVKYVYFRLGSLRFFSLLVSFLGPFALSGSLWSERQTFERFCVLVSQRVLRGRRGQPADAVGLAVSSRVCSLILCGLLLEFMLTNETGTRVQGNLNRFTEIVGNSDSVIKRIKGWADFRPLCSTQPKSQASQSYIVRPFSQNINKSKIRE